MNDRREFEGRDAEAFVSGVLDRTAGKACARAAGQLDDLLDGRLTGLDRQLVQSHLAHCGPCRELAVTLGWLTPLLPAMAVVEPGPAFLAGVLARTSGAQRARVAVGRPTGAAGLMDRLGCWWEGRILRPGFAAQVAYAATVVLVLLTAVPGAPLRGVPEQALHLVTAGPQVTPLIGGALDRANAWVAVGTSNRLNAGREHVERSWDRVGQDLARRQTSTAQGRSELQQNLQALRRAVRRGDLGGAGYELLSAARLWPDIWREWWGITDQGPPPQ
jgi:hypothetical protein